MTMGFTGKRKTRKKKQQQQRKANSCFYVFLKVQ
jgi:hypothetical protein